MFEQGSGGAALTKAILHTAAGEGYIQLSCQSLGHRTAQTADDAVFFQSKGSTAALGHIQYQLGIKGLDGMDVYDSGTDALGGKHLLGNNCLSGKNTGGNDRHVITVADYLSLTDFEFIAVLVVITGTANLPNLR